MGVLDQLWANINRPGAFNVRHDHGLASTSYTRVTHLHPTHVTLAVLTHASRAIAYTFYAAPHDVP